MRYIKVFAPGTVANLGCGFDVMGLTLDGVGDLLEVGIEEGAGGLVIRNRSGKELPAKNEDNVITPAVMALLGAYEKPVRVEVTILEKIAPGSGIGSSAASSAAAVWGVNELLGRPFSGERLVEFAMMGEALIGGTSHADNVGPAVLGGVVLLIVISLFVLALSCALGWVVAKISLKLKNKSFITVLVSLVFFGLYYFVCFRSQALIGSLLLNAASVGDRIKGSVFPLYLFGRVGCGDGAAMLIVSAVVIALLALVWYLIARSFLNIATASGNTAKAVYREKAAMQTSPAAALLRKELGRFTASPLYMLNCGLGTVFLLILAVAALIKGREVFLMMNALFAGSEDFVPVLAALCLCLLAGSNDITAPSVSLEGKSLWIAQSLPIDPWQALRAKLGLHLLITELPLMLCAVCVAAVSGLDFLHAALVVVVPMVYVVLSAAFGLFMGLKRPNLTWTSEVAPIKQGLAVFLSMFGGWVLAAGLGFLYYALMAHLGAAAFLLAATALFIVLALVLLRWLKTSGAKIYAHL